MVLLSADGMVCIFVFFCLFVWMRHPAQGATADAGFCIQVVSAKDHQEAGRRSGDGFSLREARRSSPAKSLIPDCWLFPWPGAQPAQ